MMPRSYLCDILAYEFPFSRSPTTLQPSTDVTHTVTVCDWLLVTLRYDTLIEPSHISCALVTPSVQHTHLKFLFCTIYRVMVQ